MLPMHGREIMHSAVAASRVDAGGLPAKRSSAPDHRSNAAVSIRPACLTCTNGR
jgi:hypothetical protein